MDENDCIRIQRLEVQAHIGVPDEERSSPQRLTFNLVIWPARPISKWQDQIDRAVNYADVCSVVQKFVAARGDKLIETLADALASHLLEAFDIGRVTVELRKYILPEVEFVSVTVTRERARE
jgi:dihydroneopterin aldolase